jgi:hypothetical protein
VPKRPTVTTSLKRRHQPQQHRDQTNKKQNPKRKLKLEHDSDSDDKKLAAKKPTSQKPKEQSDSDSEEEKHVKKKAKTHAASRRISSGTNKKKSPSGNMISGKRKTQSEVCYNDNEEQIVYKSARRIEKKRPSENRSPGSSGSSLSSHSSVDHLGKKSPSRKQSSKVGTPSSKKKPIMRISKARRNIESPKIESDSDSIETASYKQSTRAKKPKSKEQDPRVISKQPKRRTVGGDHIYAQKKQKAQNTIEILSSSSSEEPIASNNRDRLKMKQIKKENASIPKRTETVETLTKSKKNTKKSKNAQVPRPVENVARLPRPLESLEYPGSHELIEFMKTDSVSPRNTPSEQERKKQLCLKFQKIAMEYEKLGKGSQANPQPLQQEEISPSIHQDEIIVPQEPISSDGEFHDVNTSRGVKKTKKSISETRTSPSTRKNENTTETNTSSSQKEEQKKVLYEDFCLFLKTRAAKSTTTEDLIVTNSSSSKQDKKKELLARKKQINDALENLDSSNEQNEENEEEADKDADKKEKAVTEGKEAHREVAYERKEEKENAHGLEVKEVDKKDEDEDDDGGAHGDQEKTDIPFPLTEMLCEVGTDEIVSNKKDKNINEPMKVKSTTPKSLNVITPREPQPLSSGTKDKMENKKSKTAKDSVEQAESEENPVKPETDGQSDTKFEPTDDDADNESMD